MLENETRLQSELLAAKSMVEQAKAALQLALHKP
jgi:hypothetical protein